LLLTLLRHAALAFALILVSSMPTQAQCPATMARVLVERFISADCETCWSAGSSPAGTPLVLDWIVPSARGDDAPLAAAAIAEAAARVGALPPDGSMQRSQSMPPLRGLRISVEDGPGWNGYIGAQLRITQTRAALPAGAVGYLALVENIPAGSEGSPIARRLVRALAGPLPLVDKSTTHLRALRIPAGAEALRLASIGWVESPPGRVVALAQAAPAKCSASRKRGA
jgi:hypothetical protein